MKTYIEFGTGSWLSSGQSGGCGKETGQNYKNDEILRRSYYETPVIEFICLCTVYIYLRAEVCGSWGAGNKI
jgi:hypothetical protein